MSKNAIKRIISKDIKSLSILNLEEMGIHIKFNEENMLEAYAMIIGPKDGVYENGILYFNITFPIDYPYSPPKLEYLSRGSIRIHPNLYTGNASTNYLGKVCLSILGTWSGPQWTTIMDIGTILLSIQSLLNNNPLDNEPGFSNKKTDTHIKYAQCVDYENYRTLIYKNISDIPYNFKEFEGIIQHHFMKQKTNILDKLTSYQSDKIMNNKQINISIYRINLILNYKDLEDKINLLKFDI